MRRSVLFWVLALLVTLVAARWQERTGPTYPVRGTVTLGGQPIKMELLRSWSTGDQPVELTAPDNVSARLRWRRYPTKERWNEATMERRSDVLRAWLPHQPPAGKLEYQLELARDQERSVFPEKAAVTRFKGEVSLWILIPHIFSMFMSLLFTTRAGIEGLRNGPNGRRYILIAIVFMAVGGFVLGPLVQKAAFGAYWTGIPWGYDLTDNKTLFMAIALVFAAWRLRQQPRTRWSLVFAAAVTLVVFVIPHSVWGSEIKW